MEERIQTGGDWQGNVPQNSEFAQKNLYFVQEIGTISLAGGARLRFLPGEGELLLLARAGQAELCSESSPSPAGRLFPAGRCAVLAGSQVHEFATTFGWQALALRLGGLSTSALLRCRTELYGKISLPPPGVERALTELLSLCAPTHPRRELECHRILAGLLADLAEEGTHLRLPASAPLYLAELAHYLEEHFREDLSLDLLSQRFHVNRYYLSREFKIFFGCGYREFVIRLRIAYAKEQLRFTDRSITAIAEDAGFPSPSYLIAAFRRAEGTTPLAYRRRCER